MTGQANINIKFHVRHQVYPYDGPGNTLAHAYLPKYGGDVHFNNEEIFTINETFGKSLSSKTMNLTVQCLFLWNIAYNFS